MKSERFLFSGCLVGLCCRYDGASRPLPQCIEMIRSGNGFVVCPEQLGGLSTPRTPSMIEKGDGFNVLDGKARVLSKDGEDRTDQFLKGAKETLKIARLWNIDKVILKEKSPSCGVKLIYHGDDLVEGCGVTAASLKRDGFVVISSEEFEL